MQVFPHTPFADQKAMHMDLQDITYEPMIASGRIFLGRLRTDVGRHDLVDVLSKFGNVLDARIVTATKDGYRKRFAFCDLETMESATAAIQALHGNTDLGEPALIATHSTDTRPSPIWDSTGPVKYYGTSTTTAASIPTYKQQQQSFGSKPSSYGLVWQPSQHTTFVVAAPPPPPPRSAPGNTQNNSTISAKNNDVLETAVSSSSSSSGEIAAPQHGSSPRVPAAAPQQQEHHHQPHHHGLVPVPPHMMQHPHMPMHMPMPIAAAGDGPAMAHHMVPPPPVGQLTTLYVRGLPIDMDELGLLHYYMPFGAIVATKILRNLDSMRSRGAGFIEFFTRQESDAALKGTHRAMGPAGKELLVHYATRQLHTSRGTAAAISAPVWPVMPYPAPPGAAAAVPVPLPVVGVPSPPPTNVSSGHDTHHQVAVAMGHPMHLQAYHVPYNVYHHQGPPFHHPAHGAAPADGWQQQQQAYLHQQHQYYGYQNYPYQHSNALLQHGEQQQQQYAPTASAPVAYQQKQKQQQQQLSHSSSNPASTIDSARSDTSSTAVCRPGDPVVVVYGNMSHKQHRQAPMNNRANGNTSSSINNNSTTTTNGSHHAIRPAQYAMPPYPTAVHRGRYPLRNLSNVNGASSGEGHSAASTPGSAIPLEMSPPQKNITTTNGGGSGGGGGGTVGCKESGNNRIDLERTSSDPFPSALSASEMHAICSRVKAAARNVTYANKAITANKKGHEHGGGGGGTPDLVVQRVTTTSNAVSSSVNTLNSEDSLDSVASCGTSATAAAVIVPAASKVRGN